MAGKGKLISGPKFRDRLLLALCTRRGWKDRAWERPKLLKDIRRVKADTVLVNDLKPDIELAGIWGLVYRELQIYDDWLERIVERNREMQVFKKSVAAAQRALRNIDNMSSPDLKALLEKSDTFLAHVLLRVGEADDFWKDALARPQTEKERVHIGPIAEIPSFEFGTFYVPKESYIYPLEPLELGEYTAAMPGVRDYTLNRSMNLDSHLQIQLARIFRAAIERPYIKDPHIVSHPSLLSIARLIVLVYLCGDLARDTNAQIVKRSDGGKLTVTSVYKKLRWAQLK